MRKPFFAPIAALLLTAGIATAGSITVKDGTGASQSLLTFTFNGVQAYGEALIDTTGAQIDPATKQGQASMNTALGVPGTTSAGSVTTSLSTLSATVGQDGTPTTPAQTVQPSALSKFDTIVRSTAADRGAVLTTADTAVTLIAANASRRGMTIENQGTVKCWFSGLGTATEDYHSLLLAAGAIYESRDSHSGTGAVSMICNGANVSVYAREW